MATKEPVECPVCREQTVAGEQLDEHLLAEHSKEKLAKFIVAETTVLANGDAAE